MDTNALEPNVSKSGFTINEQVMPGSVNKADVYNEMQKGGKPELKKSHTIDHSNPTTSGHNSKTNQKMQKAMRKLELALRLSFNDK